jgi:hypothetical protein
VACSGFVEFHCELKKNMQKMKKGKKLVQNTEFFIIWRIPFPDALEWANISDFARAAAREQPKADWE